MILMWFGRVMGSDETLLCQHFWKINTERVFMALSRVIKFRVVSSIELFRLWS